MEKEEVFNKKALFLFLILTIGILFFILISNNKVSSVGEASVCCERTTAGAWCQNSPPATCNSNYRQSSTSCQATSYCRLGTCVNSQEGTCLENTPQKVCQDNSGVWVEGKPQDIPQCQLGCCLLGDQAAFVTQTRCKSLASTYGVDTNFRTDIKTETECIASANPQVKGACVLDDKFSRNCRLLTRADCQKLQTTSGNTTIEFREGLLCSAESLATNCGPSNKTTCVVSKDQVYFLDTCGNLANVYDASKINDKQYWTTIQNQASSCNPSSSNANSASCGNCDYLAGSTCKAYQRGNTQTPIKPQYGNFVCADLSCKYQGQIYQQGETWCSNSLGADKNSPGSSYNRLACFNGEVTVEPCAVQRQEICLQNSTQTTQGNFKNAACVVNRWLDCVHQDNKNDCENINKRDCQWVVGQTIGALHSDDSGNPLVVNSDGQLVPGSGPGASCVPKYAPGFNFWGSNDTTNEATQICMAASQQCVVKFERRILGSFTCASNCACIGLNNGDKVGDSASKISAWVSQRTNMCYALGDCGNKTNYIGVPGYQSKNAVQITNVGN